jgi:EAL domain-containing protein (putative c-di-GMP-specific phosphodiesterase class I)
VAATSARPSTDGIFGIGPDGRTTFINPAAAMLASEIHELKIDRSFIAEMLSDGNDAEIVKATMALGRSLGMNLVAEGVETLEQRQFLIDHGCHAEQGYLFARPLTPTDLIDKFGGTAKGKRWQ